MLGIRITVFRVDISKVSWEKPKERHNQALESFYEQFPDALEALFINKESYFDVFEELAAREL